MATEHELVSLLQGCLTCAPALLAMPIGKKVLKAVEEFEQATALGFDTSVEMKKHQDWLRKHGTREYQQWAAGILPSDPQEKARHE